MPGEPRPWPCTSPPQACQELRPICGVTYSHPYTLQIRKITPMVHVPFRFRASGWLKPFRPFPPKPTEIREIL